MFHYLWIKKYEDAALLFDKVYQLDSKFIDALRFKGRSLAALNRHKAALYYFELVLKTNPNDIVILFLKASSLVALNMLTEALTNYEQILRIQPKNSVAAEKKKALQDNLSNQKLQKGKKFSKLKKLSRRKMNPKPYHPKFTFKKIKRSLIRYI